MNTSSMAKPQREALNLDALLCRDRLEVSLQFADSPSPAPAGEWRNSLVNVLGLAAAMLALCAGGLLVHGVW